MSNLATMIMEGSMGVSSGRLKHTYGHEDGAALIAMESAEALRDIFEAEFYVPNTCTIAAAMEGASCVEESSQAAIMEASVKGAFQKIKEFFIKLKDKVVAFLHQIKRYLLGVFGNDVKWVKNYEIELKKLTSSDLKDYEVKMYKYTNLSDISKEAAPKAQELIDEAKKRMDKSLDASMGQSSEYDDTSLDEVFEAAYRKYVKIQLGKDVDDDEIDKELWSLYRDGASNGADKDSVSVGTSEINEYIKTIKSSEKDIQAFDHVIGKIQTEYDKCVKFVNSAEKAVDNVKIDDKNKSYKLSGEKMTGTKSDVDVTTTQRTNYLKLLRQISSFTSKEQTLLNKKFNAAKVALVERNKAYKSALTGAFGYARKNKKKD